MLLIKVVEMRAQIAHLLVVNVATQLIVVLAANLHYIFKQILQHVFLIAFLISSNKQPFLPHLVELNVFNALNNVALVQMQQHA